MYRNLREFIDALDRAGELVRITDPVSPVLEISQLADLASKSKASREPSESAKRDDPRFWDRGGPALLLEHVEGSSFPVLINAYGSYRRMEMAMGCEAGGFAQIAGRIADLVKPEPPRSLRDAIAKARQFAPLLKIGPKRLKREGDCQQVTLTGDAVDLTTIPILRCWPHDGDAVAVGYPPGINDGIAGLGRDGIDRESWEAKFRGRYITLAGVHTIHADDAGERKPASHNIGMYRVQLLGKSRVAMHWHVHHDGANHWRSWKKRGERMPVAIVLGGPSVLPYAATCPLPPGISELLMAGFLNRGGLRMVRAKTVPLWVPADAEMVIEGYASAEAGPIGWDPRETGEPLGPGAVFEGPFGDHTGFYSMPDRYPLVEVTAITHRRDAVYPTTIVGLPPQEDYFLGKATERIMLPLLKTIIHDIEDYDLPMFGCFHNCAFIRIRKQYPAQGRRVMHAVWGAGQMAWTKTIFVVDEDVDVHDHHAVMRAASELCHSELDCELVRGPVDILDHAAPWIGVGGKLGFDCTRKRDGDEGVAGRSLAPRLLPSPEQRSRIEHAMAGVDGVAGASLPESLGGWALVRTQLQGREPVRVLMGRLIDAICDLPAPPSYVVIVGDAVDISDADLTLFHWVANADFLRDREIVRSGPGGMAFALFDATPKSSATYGPSPQPVRAWPPILTMDPAVSRRVATLADRLGQRGDSAP